MTTINVFVVAGQSNAEGFAQKSTRPAWLRDNLINGVEVWNSATIVDYDITDVGLSGTGAAWLSEDNSDEKWGFIHYALKKIAEEMDNVVVCQITGGLTGFAPDNGFGSWNPFDVDEGVGALLDLLETRYGEMETYCDGQGIEIVPRALFWHQGETDDDAGLYMKRFAELVSRVRIFTGANELPVYYATIPYASGSYSDLVESAHLGYADDDQNAYCYNASALTLHDGTHFDGVSCIELGEWMSSQFLSRV